jgi:hypothetical protein
MAKWIDCGIRERACYKIECEVKIGQGEEREEQIDELVYEFDMQENLAADGMISMPNLTKVHQGVNGGEESSIQPSSAL